MVVGDGRAQAGARTRRCQTLFCDDKATFVKTVGTAAHGSRMHRRLRVRRREAGASTIFNDGTSDRLIEVTSFAELALAPEASDSAHPAFSKMFVETEISRPSAP